MRKSQFRHNVTPQVLIVSINRTIRLGDDAEPGMGTKVSHQAQVVDLEASEWLDQVRVLRMDGGGARRIGDRRVDAASVDGASRSGSGFRNGSGALDGSSLGGRILRSARVGTVDKDHSGGVVAEGASGATPRAFGADWTDFIALGRVSARSHKA